MVLGSLMLYQSPEVKVALVLLIPAVIFFALCFILIVYLAAKAQVSKSTTGKEGLIGETGVVLKTLNPDGQISVHGEIWSASSSKTLKKDSKIIVTAVEGMTLIVEALSDND